ncbi:MAG: alpha/beta fold hydrolase [Wenzhouxiangellaceae bacterium]
MNSSALQHRATESSLRGRQWLRHFDGCREPALRLFCFPYAGSGPSIYRDWPELLLPAVALAGVVYPGREARASEPPERDLEAIVEPLSQAILPYLDKPFAFFGHSMGAYVAYELSRRLEQRHGIRPEHLFLSAAGAPHLPEPHPIHHLPPAEFLRALLRLNGFPREVLSDARQVRQSLPVLRADFSACENYQYQVGSPLMFPLSVYGGSSDARVAPQRLEAWRQHAGVAFSMTLFDGDHFYLRPQKSRLLSAMNQELAGLI